MMDNKEKYYEKLMNHLMTDTIKFEQLSGHHPRIIATSRSMFENAKEVYEVMNPYNHGPCLGIRFRGVDIIPWDEIYFDSFEVIRNIQK